MPDRGEGAAAELAALLTARHSCRGFLADPVPDVVLDRIFGVAQRTASWCNTQPWQVHLVSGAARDRLSQRLVDDVRDNPESSDLPMPEQYVGVYQDRRREAGFALYEAVGVERSDREARARQAMLNYTFFGAPHVAIVTTDSSQGTYGAVDCGAYVANVLNAATAEGVATIAQAAIAMRSTPVREVLGLPDDRLVVCAVSLGRADPDHPANAFRTSRALPADVVVRVEA
ncbi:nitroreductase [Aeromicrobium alkaliterrae]|uniref:Nitroreductase n=1 Tax=Aeromicrobium alkaliterrae TaxID=302168 RepID=A0ABP4W1S3_9ACTN